MKSITLQTFEQAVARYFEPIARHQGWPLVRTAETTYEIRSPLFRMQIRFGVGMHSKNIDAILIPSNQSVESRAKDSGSFGVFALAGYNGIEMEVLPREQTEQGFFEYAEYIANMAKRFGLPHMLGQRFDAENVRDYWKKKSEMELEKIRGYRFPPSIQKRWDIPLPPKRDSDANDL
jgi:hypothetical protein